MVPIKVMIPSSIIFLLTDFTSYMVPIKAVEVALGMTVGDTLHPTWFR